MMVARKYHNSRITFTSVFICQVVHFRKCGKGRINAALANDTETDIQDAFKFVARMIALAACQSRL
jgi:hypothetical protein